MATTFSKIDRSNLSIDFAHYVTREQIAAFQDQFEELAINRFPRALQFALNKTSRDAQEMLADAVEQAFDRPVPFTRVNPDDLRRTSIRRWNKRVAPGQELGFKDVESKVYVMRKQSAYFKFALGETKRKPGDIGLAKDYIGIPYWPNLIDMQGIHPTREGNLPSGAMKTLARRKSKKSMNRKEYGELTLGRGHHTVFFGRPRRGGKDGQLGWYDRPEAQYQRTGPVIERGKNKGRKRLERMTDTGSPRLLIWVPSDASRSYPLNVFYRPEFFVEVTARDRGETDRHGRNRSWGMTLEEVGPVSYMDY